MLIDSHCHLNYPDFLDDFEDVLERAKKNGVDTLLCICVRLDKFDSVLSLARRYPHIFATVGIHPHDALDYSGLKAKKLVELSTLDRKVIGLGECGLDYYYEGYDKDAQHRVFSEHIKAGKESGLPLIIHCRDAEADMVDLFDRYKVWDNRGSSSPGVIHCFTGTKDFAYKAIDRGFYISVSGIVTFKKSEDLQSIIKALPLDRLLIETDAPYLAPVPKRGKRNEPAFVRHTAEFLARLKGITIEEVAEATSKNFQTLFF